ncbi:type II toxin-antitoxin system RelE/ParE family toxin [Mucilaginibacter sp. UYCu711]|uniref:type II toxin-antitoxin system RelE/ParE family toxin n=1 Tax=Mucilaginibacter sp. UYCu711 TaxID=3156339 RepID=UPI003D1AED0A
MNYQLTYRNKAENDLEDIESYYNKISPALAKRFFVEFFDTVQFIEDEPKLFQVRYRKIRIAPLYRFPYGIHYKENNN